MISKNHPALSVVMPVWNGANYIKEAIDSILAQTFQNFEFLIVDDGSTDETIAIIQSYQDPRIRLIQQEHEGIVVALNRGIAESRATWIARMDADDIAMPDRFNKQLQALIKHPDAVMCYTNFKLFYQDGKILQIPYFRSSFQTLMIQLCSFCPIAHDSVIYRKDIVEQCGAYLPTERHAEDYGLWSRMIQKGMTVGVNHSLLLVRRHEGSISVACSETQKSLARKIAIHNCKCFMNLNEDDAVLAANILIADTKYSLSSWFWFFTHCLPGLKAQGAGAWLWCLRLAFRQLKRGIC